MTDRMAMRGDRTPLQAVAMLVAAVFVLVGIAGFIPGITTHYGDMNFWGHDSGAKELGVFQVSIFHNLFHILFGLVGFALARTWDGARSYMLGGGVIYVVLWLYGWLVDNNSGANFIPVNFADNWLHAVLAVGLLGLGLAFARRMAEPSPATR